MILNAKIQVNANISHFHTWKSRNSRGEFVITLNCTTRTSILDKISFDDDYYFIILLAETHESKKKKIGFFLLLLYVYYSTINLPNFKTNRIRFLSNPFRPLLVWYTHLEQINWISIDYFKDYHCKPRESQWATWAPSQRQSLIFCSWGHSLGRLKKKKNKVCVCIYLNSPDHIWFVIMGQDIF